MKRFTNEWAKKNRNAVLGSFLGSIVFFVVSNLLWKSGVAIFSLFVIGGFMWMVVSAIIALAFHFSVKHIADEEAKTIDAELNAQGARYLKKTKVALTENYVVSFRAGIHAYRYDDILWLYPYKFSMWIIIPVYHSLNMFVKSICRTVDFAHTTFNTKAIKEEKEVIWNAIVAKSEDVHTGYDQNGMQAVAEYKKSVKEAKKAAKKQK